MTGVFAASVDQVCQARYFAEAMLLGWPVADDTALVVSELSTNAVLHSASHDGGKFWVHLEAFPGEYVWVEVRDEGGPWTFHQHDDRPHGLDIVAALAADFGVDGDARDGWIVWARLEIPKLDSLAVTDADAPSKKKPTASEHSPIRNGPADRPGIASCKASSSQRALIWHS